MSLNYIPFQPVYFGELPAHCAPCSPSTHKCGVGGTYAAPVQYEDPLQFQLAIGQCGDMIQVLDNPNLLGAESEQLVVDPTFNNGLDEFDNFSGNWSASANQITLLGNGTLDWDIPAGEGTDNMVLILNIVAINGTLTIQTSGADPTFTETGMKQVVIDLSGDNDIDFSFTGVELTLSLFEVYTMPTLPDWNPTGGVFYTDGALTIGAGTISGISQSGTLTANTAYLVEVNVIDLETPVAIYTDAETVAIQSTGVQQFVLNTGASPALSILTGTGSISIQYIRAYQWFSPSDFTVEIWEFGGGLLTNIDVNSVNVSAGALTVSLAWNQISFNDAQLPPGRYYIKVTDSCGDTLSSQPFNLAQSHDCSFLITGCMDNDAFGFDFSSFQPSVRIVAEYSEIEWPNEREEFTDTRDVNTKYWGQVNEIQHIQTNDLPKYILRFLATLPIYNTVYVGADVFSIDNDSVTPEMNQEYPTWGTVELDFKLVNHPLIMTKCDDSSGCTPPPPNCWLWEDGEEILWEDSELGCVLYN